MTAHLRLAVANVSFLLYWHCLQSMRSRVYVTVRCPSVCLSVKLTAEGLLLWARRVGDIDRLSYVGVQRVNASSATLLAYVEFEHRLVWQDFVACVPI